MATYSDLASLSNSSAFQDRARFAVTFYARYILNEGAGVLNHERRAAWAKSAFQNPGGIAGGLLPAIALDDTIQANLASSTDAQIQSATESVINTILNF